MISRPAFRSVLQTASLLLLFGFLLGGCASSEDPAPDPALASSAGATDSVFGDMDPAQMPPPEQFRVTASSLRIRKGAGTDTPVIGKLTRDSKIWVLQRDGKWGFTGFGWVHTDHLASLSPSSPKADASDMEKETDPPPLKTPRSRKVRPVRATAVPPPAPARPVSSAEKSGSKSAVRVTPATGSDSQKTAGEKPPSHPLRTAPPSPEFARIRMEFAAVKKDPKPAHLEAFILNHADNPEAAELVAKARALYKSLLLESP